MNTTINLSDSKRLTVMPMRDGKTMLLFEGRDLFTGQWSDGDSFFLTPDQAGVLIFGIEQALEVIDNRHRKALDDIRAAA